jgi:hypothetical protein
MIIMRITGTFDFIVMIITFLTNYIILCHYNILLGHFPILRHTRCPYVASSRLFASSSIISDGYNFFDSFRYAVSKQGALLLVDPLPQSNVI